MSVPFKHFISRKDAYVISGKNFLLVTYSVFNSENEAFIHAYTLPDGKRINKEPIAPGFRPDVDEILELECTYASRSPEDRARHLQLCGTNIF